MDLEHIGCHKDERSVPRPRTHPEEILSVIITLFLATRIIAMYARGLEYIRRKASVQASIRKTQVSLTAW
ncbi:hypothetical protein L218DRAFT_952963 [Marasmius fiardii PR-910]|nr:hypothetical protein L218DRAFT_952963 [Marasmius fiardii PR-910]